MVQIGTAVRSLDCMELHRNTDKLEREVDHLGSIVERLSDSPESHEVDLALSVAKRVRRFSNLVVRQLAELRDQSYSPKEGTST